MACPESTTQSVVAAMPALRWAIRSCESEDLAEDALGTEHLAGHEGLERVELLLGRAA